ncbi:MAG: response regulator [Bacteroidetes bacterium]|nr:response regulator [Bacteroidota bacterium]MCH8523425.1 response regulator [Balneolales bacterium]
MAGEIILAVDDLPQNLMTIKLGLRKFDYEIHTATNGDEALELLKTIIPDVILMDIQMPYRDGFSTTIALKEMPHMEDVPVIFLSAMKDVQSIVRCFEAGGVDYISKPFRQPELIARIETHLKIRRLKQEVDAERNKMKSILGNILPENYIQELSDGKRPTPQYYEDVVVIFADFKNFTGLSEKIGPVDSIEHLNRIFFAFDEIIGAFGLERIKTIGDGYFAVSGINTNELNGPLRSVSAMLKMQEFTTYYNNKHPNVEWKLRVGAHCGPIIAGVVGFQKIAFDVWGSTVNVAARLQSVAPTTGAVISDEMKNMVADHVRIDKTLQSDLHHVGETTVHYIAAINENCPTLIKDIYERLNVEQIYSKYDEDEDIFSRIFL